LNVLRFEILNQIIIKKLRGSRGQKMDLLKKQVRKHRRLSEICGEILYYSLYFRNRILAKKSPETLVRKIHRDAHYKKLNLDNPRTFNEKLQWLKFLLNIGI
jgi:hypothetical protein